MADYLIVDGYNIINAWGNLKETAKVNLSISRQELIETLSEFKGLLWDHILIVFDAHLSNQAQHTEEIKGVMVIYTQEGETADSLIESLVYELVATGSIQVATSDWQEQRVIMGKGALRLSARDLNNIILETKRGMRREFINKHKGRNTLGNLLDENLKNKLENIRQKE